MKLQDKGMARPREVTLGKGLGWACLKAMGPGLAT